MDESAERGLNVAEGFEHRGIADPLEALDLRDFEQHGPTSTPFEVRADAIYGRVCVIERRRSPMVGNLRGPSCRLASLDAPVAFFGAVLAFRLDTCTPALDKARLVRETEAGESLVSPVDDVNGHYYYPKAFDMVLKVVPGQSRLGLWVSGPFRVPPGTVPINFAGVVLGPAMNRTKFSSAYRPHQIEEAALHSANSVESTAARAAAIALPGILLPRSEFYVNSTLSSSREPVFLGVPGRELAREVGRCRLSAAR